MALGRGEQRAGRSLDALLVRLPGRARGWRGGASSRRAQAGGLEPEIMYAARRGDLRLHRRAVGQLGRGLRGRAVGRRGRAPAAAGGGSCGCSRRTRPPTREAVRTRGRRRGRLGACRARLAAVVTGGAARRRRRGRPRPGRAPPRAVARRCGDGAVGAEVGRRSRVALVPDPDGAGRPAPPDSTAAAAERRVAPSGPTVRPGARPDVSCRVGPRLRRPRPRTPRGASPTDGCSSRRSDHLVDADARGRSALGERPRPTLRPRAARATCADGLARAAGRDAARMARPPRPGPGRWPRRSTCTRRPCATGMRRLRELFGERARGPGGPLRARPRPARAGLRPGPDVLGIPPCACS